MLHITRENGDKYEGLIDTEDLQRLVKLDSTWSMTFNRNKQHAYLITNVTDESKKCGKTTMRLQRFIMNCPNDMVVDHINHNTLDNRKENLRVIEPSNNSKNRNKHNNNSQTGIRNVMFDKRRKKKPYVVQLMIDGKNKVIAKFSTLEDAADCAEVTRLQVYGEYAGNE